MIWILLYKIGQLLINHRVCQLCDDSYLASQCNLHWMSTSWNDLHGLNNSFFFPLADHSEVSYLCVSSNWWCQGKNSWPALPRCPNPPALHWQGKVKTDSCLEGSLFWLLRVHSMLSQLSFLVCRLTIDTEVLLRFIFCFSCFLVKISQKVYWTCYVKMKACILCPLYVISDNH